MRAPIRSELHLPVGPIWLIGNYDLPENAHSLVIFSHGSGSGRMSPRNNFVAQHLNQLGVGTLLLDLLTREEDDIIENRFDIPLLTHRLVEVTKFVDDKYNRKRLPIGYFGASTGAASALNAAIHLPQLIHAIVSRGGRPDLMTENISLLKVPTLFIVGELDTDVLLLNRYQFSKTDCEKDFKVIEGATHLFEEPGKLNEVTQIAADWFEKHLTKKNKSMNT